MKFIPLSFISSIAELKRQIVNTVVFSDLNTKFPTTSLEHYLEGTQYGFTASARENGEFKLVRITDINDGSVDWNTVPYCDCDTSGNYLLSDNDILVARTGGTTGKSFLVQNTPSNALYASYLIRLRPDSNVDPLFIYAFLNSYNYWSQISDLKSGSAQPNVNAEKLKKLKIPQCSVEIQKQVIELIHEKKSAVWPDIVNHINSTISQFETIKVYETELQTQQTLLTKLRQSILQEAVQGKLTERWRAERKGFERTGASQVAGSNPAGGSNNDKETANSQPVTPGVTGSGPVRTATGPDETGAELLTRIRAEKAELIRQGKLRKEKPLPPITDAEKPFELPDGWVWCRLGEINKVTSGITLGKKYAGTLIKVPYLRVANVQRSYINLTLVKELDIPEKELEKYKLEKNDILVNEGGDYDKVGRAAKWSGQIENCIHQNHLFKVRVIDTNPDWITLSINADHSRSHFLGGYVKTTNLASISSVTLKELYIPLPPISEQQAIVAQVEKVLAQVSELEAENQQQQAEVGRLMQAVLREAFAGKETIAEIE